MVDIIDKGLQIREARERAEQYLADAIRTAASHCPCCGSRLHEGKCWYGCLSSDAMAHQAEISAAIIAAYKLRHKFDDDESAGNYRREEVDCYAHPD